MPIERSDAFAYCAEQVRRYDSDRYATVLFAPERSRAALFSLYAFNIEIAKTREVVTQPMIGQIRLQWWRETLDGVFEGAPRRHAVALALAEVARAAELDRRLFDRLIDAREADLEEAAPETLAELLAYAEETSSTLTLLALQALGNNFGLPAMEAGREIGIAWALTGLLRAIPFHARARRASLPADLLRSAGGSLSELFALRDSPAIRGAVAELADTARARLADARRLRAEVPRAALPALLPATLADGYLSLLRRSAYNVFDPRVGAALPFRSWRLLAASTTGRY